MAQVFPPGDPTALTKIANTWRQTMTVVLSAVKRQTDKADGIVTDNNQSLAITEYHNYWLPFSQQHLPTAVAACTAFAGALDLYAAALTRAQTAWQAAQAQYRQDLSAAAGQSPAVQAAAMQLRTAMSRLMILFETDVAGATAALPADATLTALQNAATSQVTAKINQYDVLPPIPLDAAGRQEFFQWLNPTLQTAVMNADPSEVAFLASSAQLQAAFGPQVTTMQQAYQQIALWDAGIDPALWTLDQGVTPNVDAIEKAVYGYYQLIFDENPNVAWAGLAKLVGGEAYQAIGAIDNYRKAMLAGALLPMNPVSPLYMAMLERTIAGAETGFLRIQQDIFMGIAPQVAAELHGGAPALDHVIPSVQAASAGNAAAGNLELAWHDINSNNPNLVRQGNEMLTQFEQSAVQPDYQRLQPAPAIQAKLLTDSTGSPVPGGQDFWSFSQQHNGVAASFTNYDDRMRWVQGDMLPRYFDLLQQHPGTLQALIDTPLTKLAAQYHFDPALAMFGEFGPQTGP